MSIHAISGERPFECDICQKRFTLKHSMMRHRKKHAGAPPRSFDDDEDSLHGDDSRGKSGLTQIFSSPVRMYRKSYCTTLASALAAVWTKC